MMTVKSVASGRARTSVFGIIKEPFRDETRAPCGYTILAGIEDQPRTMLGLFVSAWAERPRRNGDPQIAKSV
jgi:hypothetical protein